MPIRAVCRALAAALLLLAPPTVAQPVAAADPVAGADAPRVARPRLAGRVVRRFDFEERRSNPFPVPRYWRRAQGDAAGREGFPIWNQAALDYRSPGASGEGSLRLPASGGSACLRLDPGVLPIFPGADYLVTAKVRTVGVEHARARIAARFLDAANEPIPGAEFFSDLVGRADAWTPIGVAAPGEFARAAFLQVDLELLQPARFEEPRLGAHHVFAEDFGACAWFDDVTVQQLPRITLATGAPGNVVVRPDTASLRAAVRDLAGESLRAIVTVYDADGRVADADERPVAAGLAAWTWAPRLTRLGWYRAVLEVRGGGRRVGSAWVDFVWLPPDARRDRAADADRARFGIILDRPPTPSLDETIALVQRSGVGGITWPLWHDDLTPRSAAGDILRITPLLEDAARRGVRATFALTRVPRALAEELRVASDDAVGVFTRREDAWAPYLVPFLDKFGQSVQHWRLGTPGPVGSLSSADASSGLARARKLLASLVPGPVVAVSWPLESSPAPHASPDAVTAMIDTAFGPEAVGQFASAWQESSGPVALEAVLGTLATPPYSRRDAAADLVRRTIELWRAGDTGPHAPPAVSISQPWSWVGSRHPQASPHAEYAAWRCLIDHLAGRRVTGDAAIAPGVRCVILAPASGESSGRGGALVAWREGADADAAVIRAFLGEGPVTVHDMFGNAAEAPATTTTLPGGGAGPRTHDVPVGDDPIFIEGVDVPLAQFTSSLRLDPAFAPSSVGEHEHAIVLTNPWPEPISGRLVIVEPGGFSSGVERDRSWKVSPRQVHFSIGAGRTARLPIVMSFSPVEEAGSKPLVVDAELDGRPEYGRIRLRSTFEVGLEALRVDLTYRFAPTPAGPDVVVEAQAANNGAAPVTLELTAFAPPGAGFPRARASVSDLSPGQSVVRRFSFPGGAAALRGQPVLVAVQDTSGGARINRSVTIE